MMTNICLSILHLQLEEKNICVMSYFTLWWKLFVTAYFTFKWETNISPYARENEISSLPPSHPTNNLQHTAEVTHTLHIWKLSLSWAWRCAGFWADIKRQTLSCLFPWNQCAFRKEVKWPGQNLLDNSTLLRSPTPSISEKFHHHGNGDVQGRELMAHVKRQSPSCLFPKNLCHIV